MAEQQQFQNMSKRQNPKRTDDDAEGQKSDFPLLAEKMKTVYWKQQEVADKEDLIFSLLKSAMRKVSDPDTSVQHELVLLEETVQNVKAELKQIKGDLDSHAVLAVSDHPPVVNDLNPVSPIEGSSYELGDKTSRDALQQAEQVIKQQLALKESTASGDAPLMPNSGNIIQHEEHQVTSVSVVVGRENTTVNNSTVNILSIGENAVDVDSPDFFDILKSLPLALQPSGREKPALKQPKKDMLPSSGGTAEIATEREQRTRECFRSTLQSQEKQHSTSVVQSHTVFQYLSKRVGGEWKFVGRALGLHDATLDRIRMDNSHNTQESIYQMLLCWKQENGSEATYNNLIRALQKVERNDLADEVLMSEDIMEEN